jgi:hypothetical protein
MEPDRERIVELARLTGATEQEARVLFHLQSASKAWDELPSGEPRIPDELRFFVHYQALLDMMLARIARRDHPEGWIPTGETEDEDVSPLA